MQRERAPAFGEVAVVADIDAEFAVARLEHRIAGIARLEEELLQKPATCGIWVLRTLPR